MPIIFKINPVRDMSITFSRFVPKTIALGGVATGNINANDPAIVAGSINNSGLISILIARPAKTGKKVSTVAVLDVSSVKNEITIAMVSIIIKGCISFSQTSCSPIHKDKPDSLNPVAKAKPPPNNRIISHGNFFAVFQFIKNFPFFFLDGIKNKDVAMKIATVPSLKYFGCSKRFDQP